MTDQSEILKNLTILSQGTTLLRAVIALSILYDQLGLCQACTRVQHFSLAKSLPLLFFMSVDV